MSRPRRPYRTLTPGRGTTGMITIVTAIKDANLTPIDGKTLLKAGETKVYELNLQGMLRTYTQRVSFNNLITGGFIKVEVTDSASVEPVADPVKNPENLENLTVGDQDDDESSEEDQDDDESSEEDNEEEGGAEQSELSSREENMVPPATDDKAPELSPQGENVDPLLSIPVDDKPFNITENERRKKLTALEGLGVTIVDQILNMDGPTVEEIRSIRRFPKSREGLAEKVLEILGQ